MGSVATFAPIGAPALGDGTDISSVTNDLAEIYMLDEGYLYFLLQLYWPYIYS